MKGRQGGAADSGLGTREGKLENRNPKIATSFEFRVSNFEF
jgi:hypothetical protein